jgi:WD40 repeat protein
MWLLFLLGWLPAAASPLSLQKVLEKPRPGATSVHTVAWSPDGLYIGVLWDDSTLLVLDARSPSHEIFSEEVGWGNSLAWSPDSRLLALTGEDGNTVEIWSIFTRSRWQYHGHASQITAIAWSPDQAADLVASASSDGSVQVWNARTETLIFGFQDGTAGSDGVTTLAWSPDGGRLVLGDSNGHIQVWDISTRKYVRGYPGHTGAITSLSWSSDGASIVSASYDGTTRIWNVKTDDSDSLVPCHDAPVFAAFWAPHNSAYLGIACYGSLVQIMSITYQQGRIMSQTVAVYQEQDHANGVFTIAWSPQGNQLIVGGSGSIFAVTLKG